MRPKAYMLLSWQSIGGDGNFLHIYSGCSASVEMPLWTYIAYRTLHNALELYCTSFDMI